MSKTTVSKPDDFEVEQDFWNAIRQMYGKAIDIDKFLAEWTHEQAEKLASDEAKAYFDTLCAAGCPRQVLAFVVALLRFAPCIENFWTEVVGRPRKRERVVRVFETAASTIEEAFKEMIEAEDSVRPQTFALFDRPSHVAGQLRLYCRIINFAETLSTDTEARSIREMVRFVLSSYVKRATGRFHDKEVSALIGAVEGRVDYDEVAHRMWRNRNYPRLSKHLSKATDFLFAMGTVIARTT